MPREVRFSHCISVDFGAKFVIDSSIPCRLIYTEILHAMQLSRLPSLNAADLTVTFQQIQLCRLEAARVVIALPDFVAALLLEVFL